MDDRLVVAITWLSGVVFGAMVPGIVDSVRSIRRLKREIKELKDRGSRP